MIESTRAFLASAAAAALLPSMALATLPTAVFDLRVHDTGGKDVTITHAGDSVLLDLYVMVNGSDADPTNDKFQIASGRFFSSSGGLKGDLQGIAPPSPFNGITSSPGTQFDVDSDGDLDIGNLATTATGKYVARTNTIFPQPAGGCFIGQVNFTLNQLENLTTQIQYALRSNISLGTFLTHMDENNGFANGVSNDPTKVTITYGAPVVVRGLVQVDPNLGYMEGLINTHLTVNSFKQVTPGRSLELKKGIDVTSTGSIEYGQGFLVVEINDTTSGNAGGQLRANTMLLGTTADAVFDHSSGYTRAGLLFSTAHSGHLKIGGGTFVTSDVQLQSTSKIIQTGGQALLDSLKASSGGTYQISSGELRIAEDLELQSATANSALVQSGGQTVVGGDLKITGGNASHSALLIQGGSIEAPTVFTGGSSAFLQQTGGLLISNVAMTLAGSNASGATATYALSGGELRAKTVNVGAFYGIMGIGSGKFEQSGGTVEVSSFLNVIAPAGDTASYHLVDGNLNLNGLRIARAGISGGNPFVYPGSLTQTGGSVDVNDVKVDIGGTWVVSSGSIAVHKKMVLGGTFDLSDATIPVSFGNACFADFTKGQILRAQNSAWTAGAGSLLSFPAGFDPLTEIGSLQTQGLIHIAGQPLVIPPLQNLGGSGEIEGDVTNNGLVSPGNSPGVISITGNYTQSATASLLMELAGTSLDPENPGFDILSVSGLASLDGLLSVALLDGFVPLPSDQFKIVSASSLAGTFDNTAAGITLPQGHFDVLYSPTGVTLTNFQAIPEPTGAALLMVAAGLLARRRRV